MISIQVSSNSIQVAMEMKKFAQATRMNIRRSLQESVAIIKDNTKAGMREAKSGVAKPKSSLRYRASPIRRSAIGEGLARDKGDAEKLLASNVNANSTAQVGFKNNQRGLNYVKYWEEKGRPTLASGVNKSLNNIQSIFNKNLQPKI